MAETEPAPEFRSEGLNRPSGSVGFQLILCAVALFLLVRLLPVSGLAAMLVWIAGMFSFACLLEWRASRAALQKGWVDVSANGIRYIQWAGRNSASSVVVIPFESLVMLHVDERGEGGLGIYTNDGAGRLLDRCYLPDSESLRQCCLCILKHRAVYVRDDTDRLMLANEGVPSLPPIFRSPVPIDSSLGCAIDAFFTVVAVACAIWVVVAFATKRGSGPFLFLGIWSATILAITRPWHLARSVPRQLFDFGIEVTPNGIRYVRRYRGWKGPVREVIEVAFSDVRGVSVDPGNDSESSVSLQTSVHNPSFFWSELGGTGGVNAFLHCLHTYRPDLVVNDPHQWIARRSG